MTIIIRTNILCYRFVIQRKLVAIILQKIQKYKMSDLQSVAAKKMAPPPCDEKMQVTVYDAEDGVAHGVWNVDETFLNGIGVVMGGFVPAAADIMMAYAVASKLSDQQNFVSIDLDCTFHRPTLPGKVEITATVERLGRKIGYVVSELEQNGKKVASCVSTIYISQQEDSEQ